MAEQATGEGGVPLATETTLAAVLAAVSGESGGQATAAKQDTGNTSLAAIKLDVDKLPALGTAAMAASAPVTIATDDTQVTAIKNSVAAIPAKGTAAMAGSTPVTLATNDTQMAALILAISDPTKTLAITPSDATDLTASTPPVTKGIWVGTGGDVAIKLSGDSAAVTLSNVPSGSFIPGVFARVMATNTTATNIKGFGG